MPPPLAGWAAGLDLVGVPDALALNVRTFLHRAPTLDPRAREATARQLATELAGHVRRPAPPGTPAEAYLAAVLAERSRRAQAGGAGTGWSVPGAAPSPGPGAAPRLPPAGPPAAAPPAPPAAQSEASTGFTLPQ
jgi:hypothetical protein